MINKRLNPPNPTGKGGFGDNPENRSDGSWRKEHSQNYCLNMFLRMTESEFLEWGKNNPPDKRTVAQALAHSRVLKARTELPDYREVVDRTEGKAMQPTDITTAGQSLNGLSLETLEELEKMYEKNNSSDTK